MTLHSTVRDIMKKQKHTAIYFAHPDDLVFDALKKMALNDVGALVVSDRSKIVGMLSERDYARKIVLANRTSRNTRVNEIMLSPVYYVVPDDSVEHCLEIMTRRRVRYLPVFEEEALAGIISMGDVIRALLADREFEVSTLQEYIVGHPVKLPEDSSEHVFHVDRMIQKGGSYAA